jgi:hypothetical protein
MAQAADAPAANPVHYARRRPEKTTLYQLVQEHLETFFAQVEAETEASLPNFVKDEFDAFLQCGILAHAALCRVCRFFTCFPYASYKLLAAPLDPSLLTKREEIKP